MTKVEDGQTFETDDPTANEVYESHGVPMEVINKHLESMTKLSEAVAEYVATMEELNKQAPNFKSAIYCYATGGVDHIDSDGDESCMRAGHYERKHQVGKGGKLFYFAESLPVTPRNPLNALLALLGSKEDREPAPVG